MKRAWYDVEDTGFLRDCLILLHAPYTLWHLAYVVIGASLATTIDWGLLGWTLAAFFLAMGVSAHCLDEWNDRPLQTRVSDVFLWLVALVSLAGAIVIGALVGVNDTGWVIPCMIFGGFIVFAYNLELFDGLFHSDFWFAFAWGSFPVVTAYVAQDHGISWTAAIVALACLFYSLAQRVLSKQVRYFRRKVEEIDGVYTEGYPNQNGSLWLKRSFDIGRNTIICAPEQALKFMTWAVITLAVGMVV